VEINAKPTTAIVVPTYKGRETIERVVARALEVADLVIVVDDACPQRSGELLRAHPRLRVVFHDRNRGVGGATKTGMAEAMRLGADFIVKVDSDNQMDTSFVPQMIRILKRHPNVDLVKGNRFADSSTLKAMPTIRLIGNSVLTLLVKFSSGYWTLVDPTNGFIAARASAIKRLDLSRISERYFFEIDLLCALGLDRRVVAELEMPAIYQNEHSSMRISGVLLSFPWHLLARFARRIVINYLVVELNVGSLCAIFGLPLLAASVIFGLHEWAISIATGIGRPTGTIILALMLFVIGFQLAMQALLYDVQFSPRTLKTSSDVLPDEAEISTR
jgi:dolichol-phosphate mannosyltransferase